MRAPNVAILSAIVASGACSDAGRVVAPVQSPLASKEGSTGGRILYWRGDPSDVYSMDDDGSSVIQLTTDPASDQHAAWAPDGKRVIFASNREDARSAIYIMDADGSHVTRLTYPPAGAADLFPRSLGKRIVFARTEFLASSIWAVSSDGSDLTQLTQGTNDGQPAPSPNGKLVAFTRDGDIHVLDVETGSVTNLTSSAAQEASPAWSPGGKQIAFTASGPGLGDLYVMNADGTAITRLTNTPGGSEVLPQWSPDGKRIAFGFPNDALIYGVWVMNADGTALNHLSRTHTPIEIEAPSGWAR